MDVMSMLAGMLIFMWGWMLGRHYRSKAKPPVPEPWCLCTHAFGTHDPGTGACRASLLVSVTQKNGREMDERIDCACQRYVGPDPIACGMWVGGPRELP